MIEAALDTLPPPRSARPQASDGDLDMFLETAARYLLTPRELLRLRRLDRESLEEMGLTPASLDDMIAGTN